MCASCVSAVEVLVGQMGVAIAIGHRLLHDMAARAGLVSAYDERRRDGRTVAFLTALGLDPVEVLGPSVVARAVSVVSPAPAGPEARGSRLGTVT